MHAPEIDYSTANAPRNVKFGRQGFVHNLELFTADKLSKSPIISKNIEQHNPNPKEQRLCELRAIVKVNFGASF